jgi:hypothetical protein
MKLVAKVDFPLAAHIVMHTPPTDRRIVPPRSTSTDRTWARAARSGRRKPGPDNKQAGPS